MSNILPDQLTLGLLCLSPLVAAAVLRVDGECVVVPGVDAVLPTVCWSRRWFDASCPGCGLTRAAIAAMHGDMAAAWALNPAVFAVLPALAYQVVFRAVQVWRIARGHGELQRGAAVWMAWTALAVMLAQWVGRILMPSA
jgi:hypothetical protein